jgi:hypothetical protein
MNDRSGTPTMDRIDKPPELPDMLLVVKPQLFRMFHSGGGNSCRLKYHQRRTTESNPLVKAFRFRTDPAAGPVQSRLDRSHNKTVFQPQSMQLEFISGFHVSPPHDFAGRPR